jgi:hypothetical protein
VPRRRRRNRRSPRGSSVRVTRTRGSGANKTTSYRTGGLSITGMVPTGRVASPRPTIRATVIDQGTRLSKKDIRLYLDGSEKTRFHYDQASGQLSFYVGRALSPGTYEVRIEAESESSGDQAQFGGTASRRWTFTVARR